MAENDARPYSPFEDRLSYKFVSKTSNQKAVIRFSLNDLIKRAALRAYGVEAFITDGAVSCGIKYKEQTQNETSAFRLEFAEKSLCKASNSFVVTYKDEDGNNCMITDIAGQDGIPFSKELMQDHRKITKTNSIVRAFKK